MSDLCSKRLSWSHVAESLNRPYPVSVPMVTLVSLVPAYIFIARAVSGRTVHAPATVLDAIFPLQPAWALVYGALYLFLILLPVLVVRHDEHLRRTVYAYLMVWTFAYACFLLYPTVAPRPARLTGDGFGVWGLGLLYSWDPPYNCFPSLHVAHSFVSAFACHRVHRSVGLVAIVAAVMVGLSTLYTRQHYALDVIAGVALAALAWAIFIRPFPPERIAGTDRRLAPVFAFGTLAIAAIGVAGAWIAYQLRASF
jgi:membrane-associated phospholipid phosphatase